VKQFHACINNAKVIKLPSHCSNVIWSPKSKQKKRNGNGRTCFWRLEKVATLVWLFWFGCFLFITNGSVINWFLVGTKTGYLWSSTFLSFSVYLFFWRKLVSYRDEIWAGVMFPFLTLYFFGLVVFSLLCFFFWVNCSVFMGFLLPSGAVGCSISGFLLFFLPLLLWFSTPFIETQLLASNQSCLYRTVIFPDKIVGKRHGPRSDLLQIISSPTESGAPLLKRDGEDARL